MSTRKKATSPARRPLSTRRRPLRKYRYVATLHMLRAGRERAQLRRLGLDASESQTICEHYRGVMVIMSGAGTLMLYRDRVKVIELQRRDVVGLLVMLDRPDAQALKARLLRASLIESGAFSLAELDAIEHTILGRHI
jgi:hypothetical protein